MGKARRRKAKATLTVKRVAKLLRAGVPGRHLDRGDGRSVNQVEPVRGLYLVVHGKGGSAYWELRFQLRGRTRFMGLGSTRDFDLEEARARANAARKKLADKIDPIEARRAERQAEVRKAADNLTFEDAAAEFLQAHRDTWKNAKHRSQWRNTLAQYALPKLGERPCKEIDAAAINDAVRPIWATIPETASRVRQRIERVVQWVRDGKPLPTKSNRRNKQPALPYDQLPAFLSALRPRDGIAARALEFLILTAARTNEVVGAKWSEIDMDAKEWRIPASRMKMEHEHRVPLSDRALDLLRALPTEDGNPFVFLGAKAGKGLSNMALAETVRQMNDERTRAGLPRYVDPKQNDRDIVPHGFRSCFRDWTADKTTTPNHVAEMALAHRVKGVEGDYRRGDLFEKRRQLMAAWARYGASPPRPASADVVNLHEARL